ncbi:MAG: substrate-binding domain-containing protein, partial [Clostridia bacterium]|nr:substrate-binding domain-containing protein [Clostridia bacterium]
ETLATFPDVLVAPASISPKADPEVCCTLEQIASWPFVAMHRKSVSYEMLCGYFARHGLLFHPTTFVSAMSQIVPMVCSGLGAAFMPEFMVKEQLRAGEIVIIRLTDDPPAHTVCMITRANQPASAACRELMNRLLENTCR